MSKFKGGRDLLTSHLLLFLKFNHILETLVELLLCYLATGEVIKHFYLNKLI